jgi:hypothetical protein
LLPGELGDALGWECLETCGQPHPGVLDTGPPTEERFMATGNGDQNLGDLTTQMAGWKSATPNQLHLDLETAKRCIDNIDKAQGHLRAQLGGAQGLQDWLAGANVGTFESPTTTRDHLLEDISEFITAVRKYSEYLGKVSETTTTATHAIVNLDSADGADGGAGQLPAWVAASRYGPWQGTTDVDGGAGQG